MAEDLNELRCTIPACGAPTYLVLEECIPLYRVNPPWPGAGPESYSPGSGNTLTWHVECMEGHTIWSHTDQIKVDNEAGLTKDDLTGEFAPEFRLAPLLATTAPTAPTASEAGDERRDCPTPGCQGDARYAAPGRHHAGWCRYPAPAEASEVDP